MSLNRRTFLAVGAALPLLQAASAFAADASRKLLVLVYLKGGNDAYNTFVPVANAHYYKLRPTLAIARSETIALNEQLGLNRSCSALMPAWDANELAIVQGIGQQEVTNQHFRDLEMQFTAAGPRQFLTDGWITRALMQYPLKSRDAMLDALAFGDLDIREADPMGPFRGDKLRVVQVQHPTDWFAARQLSAIAHLSTHPGERSAAAFLRPADRPLKTTFPRDEFGQALQATVELVAAGLAPPVVHITLNADDADQHHAFDCHWKQRDFHGAALARLATGLAAFRAGMQEVGAWQNTLVATYDEFGRSAKENQDQGTHHGWASTHIVMGGMVKGGLYGKAPPALDVFAIDGPPPVIDYRELYATIIESWWGSPSSGIFERRFRPLDLLRV